MDGTHLYTFNKKNVVQPHVACHMFGGKPEIKNVTLRECLTIRLFGGFQETLFSNFINHQITNDVFTIAGFNHQ